MYRCECCRLTYSTKYSLQRHVQKCTFNGDRKVEMYHICGSCNKRFATKSSLIRHQRCKNHEWCKKSTHVHIHHTVNLNINVNIHAFGNEEVSEISDHKKVEAIIAEQDMNGIPMLAREIFLNEDIPCNINLHIKNSRSGVVLYYNERGEWQNMLLDEAMRKVVDNATYILREFTMDVDGLVNRFENLSQKNIDIFNFHDYIWESSADELESEEDKKLKNIIESTWTKRVKMLFLSPKSRNITEKSFRLSSI